MEPLQLRSGFSKIKIPGNNERLQESGFLDSEVAYCSSVYWGRRWFCLWCHEFRIASYVAGGGEPLSAGPKAIKRVPGISAS